MADNYERLVSKPGQSVIGLIEKVISEVTAGSVSAADVKDPAKNIWYLKQGSANFDIELFDFKRGDQNIPFIEVRGIIMKVPEGDNSALHKHLLTLNASGPGTFFCLRNDLVILAYAREVEGLDYVELKTTVDDIRYFADYWDDILMEQFGGSKG
jgi:hypothetical protein